MEKILNDHRRSGHALRRFSASWLLLIVATIGVLVCAPITPAIEAQDEYDALSTSASDLQPWEQGDIGEPWRSSGAENNHGIIVGLSLHLIGFYRSSIAPSSISRCPFFISCSHFAEQGIRKYGFVKGLSLFIDRHFYRENVHARYLYQWREDDFGVLKLDDSFFLDQ